VEEVKDAVDRLLKLVPTEDKDNAINIMKEIALEISYRSAQKVEDVCKNGFGWISFKDVPPPQDMLAVVCNASGWMNYSRALYHAKHNVWVKYDPQAHEKDVLEVTHYIPIPPNPKIERKDKE